MTDDSVPGWWLIRLNATVSSGGGSFTDGYAKSVEAPSAAGAAKAVLDDFLAEVDGPCAVQVLPWAWRLGADARPVDEGHRVELFEGEKFEVGA